MEIVTHQDRVLYRFEFIVGGRIGRFRVPWTTRRFDVTLAERGTLALAGRGTLGQFSRVNVNDVS